MNAGKREDRRRKYLKLGTGELAAAAVFAVAALFFVTPRLPEAQDGLALWSALIPLLFVLVSAGVYWLLARSWVERARMPRGVAASYRLVRVVSLLLLAGGVAGLIAWWPHNLAVALFIAGVWIFAAVEFTNYFIVRLAYPVATWFATVTQWRTPQLVADMRTSGE